MLIEPFETDAEETHEWLDSVDGLVETGGVDRAGHLLRRTLERTRSAHIVAAALWGLFLQGETKADTVNDSIRRYGIDPDLPNPRNGQ